VNAVRCILMYHGSETLEHRFAVCWDSCDELLELRAAETAVKFQFDSFRNSN